MEGHLHKLAENVVFMSKQISVIQEYISLKFGIDFLEFCKSHSILIESSGFNNQSSSSTTSTPTSTGGSKKNSKASSKRKGQRISDVIDITDQPQPGGGSGDLSSPDDITSLTKDQDDDSDTSLDGIIPMENIKTEHSDEEDEEDEEDEDGNGSAEEGVSSMGAIIDGEMDPAPNNENPMGKNLCTDESEKAGLQAHLGQIGIDSLTLKSELRTPGVRRSYTLQFKKAVLKYRENHSGEETARVYGITASTLRGWRRRRTEIAAAAADETVAEIKKRLKGGGRKRTSGEMQHNEKIEVPLDLEQLHHHHDHEMSQQHSGMESLLPPPLPLQLQPQVDVLNSLPMQYPGLLELNHLLNST